MYLVVTNKFSRRSPPVTHRIDIHDLKIPNCEYKAHQLGGPDLYKDCKRLRVPGVDAFTFHQNRRPGSEISPIRNTENI